MEFQLKARDTKDGIVMYCAEREDGHGDFAAVVIRNGFLEFRFDTGSGNSLKYHQFQNPQSRSANVWVVASSLILKKKNNIE